MLTGLTRVNLGFWVVDDNTADDWRFASSDYTSDETKRPEVSLTWRTGLQWLPSEASGLYPIDESTLWNLSASRPSGAEGVAHSIGQLENQTRQGGLQKSQPTTHLLAMSGRLKSISRITTHSMALGITETCHTQSTIWNIAIAGFTGEFVLNKTTD